MKTAVKVLTNKLFLGASAIALVVGFSGTNDADASMGDLRKLDTENWDCDGKDGNCLPTIVIPCGCGDPIQ